MYNIAIKGHPFRGKEVIQILESLGGINPLALLGTAPYRYYYICDDNVIRNTFYDTYYKIYTLEEFETEFPFKIGDIVITNKGYIGVVEKLIPGDIFNYYIKINNKEYWCSQSSLRLYKEMEIRNITLTLNKAKEWYNKGGELKEVALQTYSEEELTKTELPKTFEEFCDMYPVKKGECWIGSYDCINICTNNKERTLKNWLPSKKSAEAHLALMQLEQLRDCYRQGDIPDFTNNDCKYVIVKNKNDIHVAHVYHVNYFLSFTKKEVAEEYLTNFKPLIKIAEDYI